MSPDIKPPFTDRPAPLDYPTLPDRLPFAKMEGAGNDYIYIEEMERELPQPAALALNLSNRHFGIGSDGLVLIGKSTVADVRMRMFNSDGSESEMCGNAIRCVGKYVHDNGIVNKTPVTVETLAGLRTVYLNLEGGEVVSARVDMGKPIFRASEIPVISDSGDFVRRHLVVHGCKYLGSVLSMGNPHLVINLAESEGPDSVEDLDIAAIGPFFEHHPIFPSRVNTEFINILSRDRIRMRVWERGAGETLACGTGASAVAVACAINGETERRVTVELKGGDLKIDWAEDDHVYLTGGCRTVFTGVFHLR